MLSKVTKNNWIYGTEQIKKFINVNNGIQYDSIHDNLQDSLLIKKPDSTNTISILYNYIENKIMINSDRIRLKILNKYFWKQSDSFDQNNILIANNIRLYVIKQFDYELNTNKIILGIGGEYYVYYPFVKASKYIGISNHQSIISDANYNLDLYRLDFTNHLVDYNNILNFPSLNKNNTYDVLINVSNIHQNHIEWISKYNIEKLVIITCKPIYKKIPLIKKYFIIKKIKHFINISSIVYVITCVSKSKSKFKPIVKYISLGSNCSVTHQLNKYGLRTKSYPFDWAKISIGQLINVLENNFISYTDIQIKKMSHIHLDMNLNPTLLLSNPYNIHFAHEVINNSDSYINEFKIKLYERIKRFDDLKLLSKIRIQFIRIELSKNTLNYFNNINILIIQLEKIIGSDNKFELILIIHKDSQIPNNLDKRIKIYKFDNFNSDWKLDNLDWNNYFL